jgi:DNA-binding transcriptional regulator YiaG
MIDPMTKAEAIHKAGSIANLARILGITTNAISNWSDEKNIPPGREWQLRAVRPEWFYAPKEKK